jgi:dTDP-4-dehydrorhamnose reductase
MKILIIGANSFVGKALAKHLSKRYELIGTYHNKKNKELSRQERLDMTRKRQVREVLEDIRPDTIIITAAISTNKAPEETIRAVNVEGTSNIIATAAEMDPKPKIIFFSTNQVFDGKTGQYKETDKPKPINNYGKSKAEAEKMLLTYDNHLILRCSVIVGKTEPDDHDNFITMFLNATGRIKIFKNVYRSPTYVRDIPPIVETLIELDTRGILNMAGDDFLSYAEMASCIEKKFGIEKQYDLIDCDDYNIPKRLGLNTERLKKLTGHNMTSFNDALDEIKKEMQIKNETGDIQ